MKTKILIHTLILFIYRYSSWFIFVFIGYCFNELLSTRHPLPPRISFQATQVSQEFFPQNTIIRLGTYNIHRGKGIDKKRDLNRIAETLLKPGLANIIVLNEVAGSTLDLGENQAQKLAEVLDKQSMYAPTERRWMSHNQGNAILSDHFLQQWETIPLVHRRKESSDSIIEGKSYRNMIVTQIYFEHIAVKVIATHIDTWGIKPTQIQKLLDTFIFYQQQGYPVILLGDLNVSRENEALQAFMDNHDAVDAIKVANPLYPEKMIDWILVSGFEVLDGGIEPIGPSDHPYFWVDVKLLPK